MNVLLVGHKGYLGKYLLENINSDIRIETLERNQEDCRKDVDVIINCAGLTSVERCEEDPTKSFFDNYQLLSDLHWYFPKAKIIHFSSYYVYNGSGFCSEQSDVTRKYVYMKHKLDSEKIVEKAGGVVFRLGKLFGTMDIEKHNRLPEHIIKNESMNLDLVMFNPCSLAQVHRAVDFQLRHMELSGIFNLANDGYCSHRDFGIRINKIMGTNKNIQTICKVDKIFNNYGKTLMLLDKIRPYITLVDWQKDLEEYLRCLRIR